jgi:hypothetical protein
MTVRFTLPSMWFHRASGHTYVAWQGVWYRPTGRIDRYAGPGSNPGTLFCPHQRKAPDATRAQKRAPGRHTMWSRGLGELSPAKNLAKDFGLAKQHV